MLGEYFITYYFIRNIVNNVAPFATVFISIWIQDVIFLETDWWLHVVIGVLYVLVNGIVSIYSDENQIYFLDWSRISKIIPYSPLVSLLIYELVTVSFHFFISIVTQLTRNRYEFEFGSFSPNVGDD